MPGGIELLAAAPWIVAAVLFPLMLLHRSRVRRYPRLSADAAPFVSIIVPARNEAENIGACVATLVNSEYPALEVIVVDDQSTDGTDDVVRLIAERSQGRVRLVEGTPPPAGWIGKAWACWQGYRVARGSVLLFTDADTRHDDTLLPHAVGALHVTGADLLSVLPRQRMITFWERVVLPQIFTTIILRFHDVERVSRARRPRDVIANGQYMLFSREAYEAIGGHEAVRDDVVEDLGLAQRLIAAGRKLRLAHADDMMEVRMYRSLGGIMEGWTKNLALGSRRTVHPFLAPLVPWALAAFTFAVWVLPPVLLGLSVVSPIGDSLRGWTFTVTMASVVTWALVHLAMRIPPQHALLYPLGSAIVTLLFVKSGLRGSRVVWRGREYRDAAATPPTPP